VTADLVAWLQGTEQTVRSMVLTIMGVANLTVTLMLSTRCQARMNLHFHLQIFKQFLRGTMPLGGNEINR